MLPPERQRLLAARASLAGQKCALLLLVVCSSLAALAPTSAKPAPVSPGIAATSAPARTTPSPALHYEVLGAALSGTPMVMIHGFGQHAYAWRHLARPLARDRQIVLLDLKGFGNSPKPIDDDRYSLIDQARLVTEVIEHLQLPSVILVGNSYGGGVALLVSLDLLDGDDIELEGLILIDGIAYEQDYPYFIDLLRTPGIGSLLTSLIAPEFQVRQILELAYHDDSKIMDDQIKAYAEQIKTPEGRHALVETARQIVPPNLERITRRYREISVPTLLLWGEEDRIVPVEVAHRLDRELPNSELVLLSRVGHLPQEEAPQPTLDTLREFLRKKSL